MEFTPIYKVDLNRGEELELKYITQHSSGAFIYSSNKGVIGFQPNWVKMPEMKYSSYCDIYLKKENAKEYFEITPIIKLTSISVSNSGFATATIDSCILQFKKKYHQEINIAIRKNELEENERQRKAKIVREERENERRLAIRREENRIYKIKIDKINARNQVWNRRVKIFWGGVVCVVILLWIFDTIHKAKN